MTKKRSSAAPAKKAAPDEIEHLKLVLADTFVLYMKTYAVHWNYEGPNFFSVHKLTETQYEELATAVDEIAERIRAKGAKAPVSLAGILQAADLREMRNSAEDQLRELMGGHELLARRAQEAAEALEEADDLFSNDMMIGRIGAHEKAAWMIGSVLHRR